MRVETYTEPQAFMDVAGEFLHADPVVNNVLATVTRSLIAEPDRAVPGDRPLWAALLSDDPAPNTVLGAVMRTAAEHGIYTSRLPDGGAVALAADLPDGFDDAEKIAGTEADAGALAETWARRTGRSVEVLMRQRIHRLDVVRPPTDVPGHCRLAGQGDLDLLTEWSIAFEAETSGREPRRGPAEVRPRVTRRVTDGLAHVWDDDGVVCYVGTNMPVAGAVRIGPVYTPPDRRGRGYASALTAAASEAALDAGATMCTLYTDLANPTSNKIYAAVGYRPVCDVTMYRLPSPSPG